MTIVLNTDALNPEYFRHLVMERRKHEPSPPSTASPCGRPLQPDQFCFDVDVNLDADNDIVVVTSPTDV